MSIVENLVSKGGREWAGKRVYVGEALACSLMGLRVTRYGSGNVSSAAMNGSPISNRDAAVLDMATGATLTGGERARRLESFRQSGQMWGAIFPYGSESHEDSEDESTWGPESPAHVDWTGFSA